METDINDGFMPSNIGKRFQSKLDMLKYNSDWNRIITMLKRYASKYPNEYYIFQQLAETYYIESIGQYQLAYQCAEKAFSMEPDSILFAKALINDSIYMMGVICQNRQQYKVAEELFVKHLSNRKRGQYSDFTKRQVLNNLASITNNKQNE